MAAVTSVSETSFTDLALLHRGKVRDVYEISADEVLLVATDRISAFDCILPTPISQKGEILTALSLFWFQWLEPIVANHLLVSDFDAMPEVVRRHAELRGRSMLVKRAEVFPVECVVRGYLEGSAWKDYQAKGEVCGHQLPAGLLQCSKLPESLFTPATKAKAGHDENITEDQFVKIVGEEAAERLRTLSLKIFAAASEYALTKGIIIADTKFEFGIVPEGGIILVDEVLTPDSSRFWDAKIYEPGKAQPSFDKQFVREYLETLDWNKQPPAPALPQEIADATRERYLQAFRSLTGKEL